MPEAKKGRMADTYSKPKTEKGKPQRGERTSTHKERTKSQPKTKGKMGY